MVKVRHIHPGQITEVRLRKDVNTEVIFMLLRKRKNMPGN